MLTIAAAGTVLAGCELIGPTVASPHTPVPATASPHQTPSVTPPGEPQQTLVNGLRVRTGQPVTGYQRSAFGQAWSDDVDVPGGHNGCDTRNDILGRDLTATTRPGGCRVTAGTLVSPYTGATIHFHRGPHSSDVQIDHVVPLGDAWISGANTWTPTQRRNFANDPANLLAVDGPSNEAKSDHAADQWLPSLRRGRCLMTATQVRVKNRYRLTVTGAELTALRRTLAGC